MKGFRGADHLPQILEEAQTIQRCTGGVDPREKS